MEIYGNYIYGSSDSTDIDIAYIVDKLPSLNECKIFCSSDKNENRNLITIDDGIISNCYKGTKDELNNAIKNTYSLHHQNTPLLITKNVKRNIPLKIVRSIRSILSHLSRSQYRLEVKLALRSDFDCRLNTLLNIDLTTIDFTTLNNNMSKEDILKLIAFQSGQCLGLINGDEYFTKKEISLAYPELSKFIFRIEDTDISILNTFVHNFVNTIKNIEYLDIDDNNVLFINDDIIINLKTEQVINN